ncbi:MAG: type II secretion system protein [Bacteroidetes bacterium]|nr:type II secretion system protein [Bacteroidota bacterium]MCA6444660.1 type II secretion system protein [Bacteroidota bacterium]
MLKRLSKHKLNGMSLIEILIVLAIVGILLSMAVPKFMKLIGRSKSLEAQTQLKYLVDLQTNFFYINSKYSNSLNEVGFEQATLVTEGGKANYKIEISDASSSNFTAKATAVVDFDQDGQFNVWQVNNKSEIKEVIED